jgi:hypothetical protein
MRSEFKLALWSFAIGTTWFIVSFFAGVYPQIHYFHTTNNAVCTLIDSYIESRYTCECYIEKSGTECNSNYPKCSKLSDTGTCCNGYRCLKRITTQQCSTSCSKGTCKQTCYTVSICVSSVNNELARKFCDGCVRVNETWAVKMNGVFQNDVDRIEKYNEKDYNSTISDRLFSTKKCRYKSKPPTVYFRTGYSTGLWVLALLPSSAFICLGLCTAILGWIRTYHENSHTTFSFN